MAVHVLSRARRRARARLLSHIVPADRAAWDQAMADYQRCCAAYAAYEPTFERVGDAYEAEVPDVDKIDLSGFLPGRSRHQLAFDEDLDALERWVADGEGKFWWGDKFGNQYAKGIAALRRFRADRAAVRARLDYDAVCDRMDALGSAKHDAGWAVFNVPAPDLDALHWKAERLFGADAMDPDEGSSPSWSFEIIGKFMADVRRLTNGSAAA